MNREIKFRAWDKVAKQIVDVVTIDFNALGKISEVDTSTYCWSDRFDSSKLDNIVLMQFTGRRDKEGREIYDGDIIEFDRREWGGDDNIHIVEWDNNNSCWEWGGGGNGDMEWRKVIGNIYENPELLQ